jgi:hypothetical protein
MGLVPFAATMRFVGHPDAGPTALRLEPAWHPWGRGWWRGTAMPAWRTLPECRSAVMPRNGWRVCWPVIAQGTSAIALRSSRRFLTYIQRINSLRTQSVSLAAHGLRVAPMIGRGLRLARS